MVRFNWPINKLLFIGIIFIVTSECVKSSRLSKRSVTIGDDNYKWRNGVIMYKISSYEFSNSQILSIFKAMKHWEKFTCIKFDEVNPEIKHPNFIKFRKSLRGRCDSNAGQYYSFENTICLKDSSTYQDIIRQLGHIIGLYYEHQRPDRDEYLRVNNPNIKFSYRHEFEIKDGKNSRTFGLPYDFNSIMHLGRKFGARDKSKDTLTPVKEVNGKIPVIGEAPGASEIDFQTVNLLYNCPKCGRTIHDDKGKVSSAEIPKSDEIAECEWRIKAPHGFQTNFIISSSSEPFNCSGNDLEILDGVSHENPLPYKLCQIAGQTINLQNLGHDIVLKYHRSGQNPYLEFTATYKFTCNHTIAVDEKKVYLQSPNWPEPYGADQKCFWRLEAPKNQRLTVKLDSVELEKDSKLCSLKFDDGSKETMACSLRKSYKYFSTGNHLDVVFVPTSSGQGFSIYITAEP